MIRSSLEPFWVNLMGYGVEGNEIYCYEKKFGCVYNLWVLCVGKEMVLMDIYRVRVVEEQKEKLKELMWRKCWYAKT